MKRLWKSIKSKLFKEELTKLSQATNRVEQLEAQYKAIFDHLDVSVDVNEYSRSWACISIQGQKQDYIKFIDLGERDLREIQSFLRQFDRSRNVKIDASPMTAMMFKRERFG